MAKILIEPVNITTDAGYPAIIDGIDPSDSDCLKGNVTTPALGTISCCWNDAGLCRNNSQGLNISPNDDDVLDVLETVKSIKN